MKKLYIAYGSNMDENQMALRCPDGMVVGQGIVEGYELIFRGKNKAYATIRPKEGSVIPVLVWEISESDEHSLDEYEVFPSLYYKREMEVSVNGAARSAMVYIMEESNPLNLPSPAYFEVLKSAYLKYGFDMDILMKGMERSVPDSGIK